MTLPRCTGNGWDGDHCCYLGGKVCEYLVVDDNAERRFSCGLLVKYGNWKAMNASPEYQPIGQFWESKLNPFNYCESFNPVFCCRPELRAGRHNDRDGL